MVQPGGCGLHHGWLFADLYWLQDWRTPLLHPRRSVGLFLFNVMPFGLHGAPATFTRSIKVLQGCERCDTWEERVQHLSLVLGKVLGWVDATNDKVEAIKNYGPPGTMK